MKLTDFIFHPLETLANKLNASIDRTLGHDLAAKAGAEQGNAKEQFNLGNMYRHGTNVPKDAAEAVKWYRKAAEQGHADAQFTLAWMYAFGKGVHKDAIEAVKWWLKAAEQGHAGAQSNLGRVYGIGEGVPKNDAEAYKWCLLSSAQGNREGKRNARILERGVFLGSGKLTPEMRAKGQHMASEFVARPSGK